MMHEIKFRGKGNDGEWRYGNLVYMHGLGGTWTTGIQIQSDGYRPFGSVNVEPKTVGQFTGLKDKNGKEIYEGDIIHSLSPFFTGEGTIHDYDDDYYKVVWEDTGFRLETKDGLFAYMDELIEPRVIGNIYENPELWEEQHG